MGSENGGRGAVDQVIDALRDDILGGRYHEGDRLPSERDLAERIGVNRGAVREALRALDQLGIVERAPGGARVASLRHASLDVVEHLLDLHEVPDAGVVDQVLEVHAYLISGCARMAVEGAEPADLERVREILRPLRDLRSDVDAYTEGLHELAHLLVDGSGNFVMGLVAGGLRLPFFDKLRHALQENLPREQMAPLAERLDEAILARDARDAAEVVHAMLSIHRERIVSAVSGHQAAATAPRTIHRRVPRALRTPDAMS